MFIKQILWLQSTVNMHSYTTTLLKLRKAMVQHCSHTTHTHTHHTYTHTHTHTHIHHTLTHTTHTHNVHLLFTRPKVWEQTR